jgi:VanZ family protein
VEHLVGFGGPLLLVLLTLAQWSPDSGRRIRPRTFVIVVSLFVLHGVLSEVIQATFYVSRSGDPKDLLADCTGIMLAVLGYRLLARRRSRQARP